MPRPWRHRRVQINPEATYFKPRGIPLADLKSVDLHFDELEAVRLVDFAELDQEAAAKKMGVSTSTFQRTLYSGRKKIAQALVYGQAIEMKDRKGVMFMPGGDGTGPMGTGPVMGAGRGRGAGRGLGVGRGAGRGLGRQPGGRGMGPGGECVCPSCNTRAPHTRGVPCFQMICPKCGTKMVRAS